MQVTEKQVYKISLKPESGHYEPTKMATITNEKDATMAEKKQQIKDRRKEKAMKKKGKGMLGLALEKGKKSDTNKEKTQQTIKEGFQSVTIKKEHLKATGGAAYTQPSSKEEVKEGEKADSKQASTRKETKESREVEFYDSDETEDEVEDVTDMEVDEEKEAVDVDMSDEDEDIYNSPETKGSKRKSREGRTGSEDSPSKKNNVTTIEIDEEIKKPPSIKSTIHKGNLNEHLSAGRRDDKKDKDAKETGLNKGKETAGATKAKPTSSVQKSLHSYADKARRVHRTPKDKTVRLRFRYSVPKSRTRQKAPIAELLQTLVDTARQIDKESMIMPWDDDTAHLGPLNLQDFTYANKVTLGDMKNYLDLPFDVKAQGFVPGRMEYQIGVRFTTEKEPRSFKNAWDMQKKDRVYANKMFVPMKLAEHQDSPKAYLIGVAAGSTENMEFDSINRGLSKITGIKNIAVNYQTFHQVGITKDIWTDAYRHADNASKDKSSRAYNKTKYAWAPEGLCIYVTDKTQENEARMKLLKMYGECKEDGTIPVWPGGSSMRFIPLKATYIKNTRTRNKVEKRVKVHICLKVEEVEVPTDFQNIDETIEEFEGKTFQEVVMEIESKTIPGAKLFRHFNHAWDRDPAKKKWAMSVHTKLCDEAIEKMKGIKNELEEKYGTKITKFFAVNNRRSYYAARGTSIEEEDEDNWFQDNEIISAQEKSILLEGVTEAMFGLKTNGGDDPSWGSAVSNVSPGGETKASTSTLTQSTATVPTAQVDQRKIDIRQTLKAKGYPKYTINSMIFGSKPYELISECFKANDYSHTGMVALLSTMHEALSKLPSETPTPEESNNEDENIGENTSINESDTSKVQGANGAQKDQ